MLTFVSVNLSRAMNGDSVMLQPVLRRRCSGVTVQLKLEMEFNVRMFMSGSEKKMPDVVREVKSR